MILGVLKREQTPSDRPGPGMRGLGSAQGLCFGFVVVYLSAINLWVQSMWGTSTEVCSLSATFLALITRLRRSWSHWQ